MRVKTECSRNRKDTSSGFTLLEVLAAVLILGLSYVAVLQCFSVALKNISKIETSRSELFEEKLTFSRDTKFSGLEAFADEEREGIPFIEGQKYRLIEIVSESGELSTLVIESVF